ncbi:MULTISPECIES: type IV toxin-antitoxin system AbiEi family antitoxin [unclassified Mycobacterium]|uniref:type IV toxin-antitoxin system AbiEi family antitoxin n=1 Tax=unclassified Mycobacterium TaxID=2642494 RepID=UPI00073FCDB5|nr:MULTISPECIES: type IV toxin-antitoxin system AbiEi family antitoxin [unclassified Mycobacterium]KUH86184.1 hypothetical protein AU187_05150 [Mycobacterium sp. IS-1556]KUH86894.1 hypothetical protein AU185_20205 [Mycobacterium sp. GA-0227b]KUH92171.1 hypothetical protein AU186_06920 [Mycobacterium sp. GA-1999]
MEDVFVGTEAVASGALTRRQLRWNYRRMFPDVYSINAAKPQLAQRILGAWLWPKRHGVIAGAAAAVLHGARLVNQEVDVELIWRCGRPPHGIRVRNERIEADEIAEIAGLPVTTPERTALDLARHAPRDSAVVHLDALARATRLTASEVEPLLDRYRGSRAIWHAIEAVALMDDGSSSPRETLTRLALSDAGFPPPKTDFMVTDGGCSTRVAMGYDAPMVGVDFGEDSLGMQEKAGWTLIAAADATPLAIMCKMRMAVAERGYPLWRLQRLSRA